VCWLIVRNARDVNRVLVDCN